MTEGGAASGKAMRQSLQRRVVPALRQRGFTGSLPHFRRITPLKTDLMTFQFDRYGGGFVIEVAEAPPGSLTKSWGKVIAPSRLCALNINPPARRRLRPGSGHAIASWFRYDDGTSIEAVADAVLRHLPQVDAWFAGEKSQPNIR